MIILKFSIEFTQIKYIYESTVNQISLFRHLPMLYVFYFAKEVFFTLWGFFQIAFLQLE